MSNVQTLASTLYRRAVNVLSVLPELDQEAPLAAIDAFVERPLPSRFLAAMRAMTTAMRGVRLDRVREAGAGHTFQKGMAALTRIPGVDRYLLEQLRGVPVDGRAGKRLEALAALMGAHQELAARAEAASQALRDQLSAVARRTTSKTTRKRPAPAPRPVVATPARKMTAS